MPFSCWDTGQLVGGLPTAEGREGCGIGIVAPVRRSVAFYLSLATYNIASSLCWLDIGPMVGGLQPIRDESPEASRWEVSGDLEHKQSRPLGSNHNFSKNTSTHINHHEKIT
jgi:hypothetical protein